MYPCQEKKMLPTHRIAVHQKNSERGATGVLEAQEERVSSVQVNHALSTKMGRNNGMRLKCF